MARLILMDAFHLAVRVPRGLPPAEDAAVRRTPDGPRFRAALGRAPRDLTRRYSALNNARVAVGR